MRRNGRGVDRGAGLGGDRLGGGVGLLGREAALLDRAGGGVAGGEHVGHAAHARVRVDLEEAVARRPGSPAMRGPRRRGSAITASAAISSPVSVTSAPLDHLASRGRRR